MEPMRKEKIPFDDNSGNKDNRCGDEKIITQEQLINYGSEEIHKKYNSGKVQILKV